MLKFTMISNWKLFSYENVCPVPVERQVDFHTSADDFQFSDSAPIKRGGPILLISSIMI